MEYNIELNKAIELIKKNKPKTTLIQLPDGLKPLAKQIKQEIEESTKTKVLIWAGTCFGACDTPKVNTDLIIQWGHSEWR